MTHNPISINEIAYSICSFMDNKDLYNLALTRKQLYHPSCYYLWKTLNPKTVKTLHKIKKTLDSTSGKYSKFVHRFHWKDIEGTAQNSSEETTFKSFLFPNLRELEFNSTSAGDQTVYPMVAASPFLSSLNLSKCYGLSVIVLEPLLTIRESNLKSLILYGCANITLDVVINVIYRHADSLERLKLTSINDEVLEAIEKCKRLHDLGLEHCSDTSLSKSALDKFFESLAKNQVQLQNIQLRDIENLDSEHLKTLSKSSSQSSLIHFDISECKRVSKDGIAWLAQECTSIQSLLLVSQSGVTNEVIQLFISNCHYLKHVDISGCTHLTDQAFYHLIEANNNENDLIPFQLETLNLSGLDFIFENSIIPQLILKLPNIKKLCLGSSFDLDVVNQMLEIINQHHSNRFFIYEEDSFYTICRESIEDLRPVSINATTNTTSSGLPAVAARIFINNNSIFSLPSIASFELQPNNFTF